MSEHTSLNGFVNHVAGTESPMSDNQISNPANFSNALTTPISAPPAIKPLAMSVPRSPRCLFTSASLLREVTHQLIAPPTTSGTFSSKGMNIPNAKANAGTLHSVRIMANSAPMP